jgi:glycosyltransferase involved in cell wall biosynthesis
MAADRAGARPRRIKVAIVVTRMDLGGAQEAALETAVRLDQEIYDVRLLAGKGGALDGEASERLRERFVPVKSLVHPVSPLKDAIALAWLWAFFVRGRFDVVHTHSSKAGLLGRIAAFLARTPRVIHTVHGWSFNDFQGGATYTFFALLERRLARISDRLIVVAASLADKGLALGIGDTGRYALVRAGIDLEAWRNEARRKGALKREIPDLRRKVVGVVANLKPQKAPLDFVRVAAKVCAERPDVDFVYVGGGPLLADARDLAEVLGVGDRVRFLGWKRNPRALAAGFDVFLLPSLFEGLPCVFPQALALGVPVVASCVDGAAEAVREGVNGFLCQPRDIEALADRVGALLDDSALRRRFSAAARASVGEEFGFDAMARGTAAVYAGATPR